MIISACLPIPKSSNYPKSVFSADPLQTILDANASRSTAAAAVATADFFSTHLTATAEAQSLNFTQEALLFEAKATERAWNATATSDAVRSTALAAWTQRAIDITSTADIAAVQAYATQQHGLARNAALAVERKELMNQVAAIVPWSIGIGTFMILLISTLRWSRVRVIQRDPRGDAPLLLDVVEGVAYDADRHPSSTAGLQRRDLKSLPNFPVSAYTQATSTDQAVDLATRTSQGSANKTGQGFHSSATLVPPSAPRIEVIQASKAKPLFHDVVPNIFQDAIEAEIISDGETSE